MKKPPIAITWIHTMKAILAMAMPEALEGRGADECGKPPHKRPLLLARDAKPFFQACLLQNEQLASIIPVQLQQMERAA
jgi:hypothetical protein